MGRISVHQLKQWKAEGKRFAMITAYDYPSARLVEQAGIPIILVGDSLGSVILGFKEPKAPDAWNAALMASYAELACEAITAHANLG